MKQESLVSITDFSKEEILDLLEKTRRFEENPDRKVLEGKVIATLFFEPSPTPTAKNAAIKSWPRCSSSRPPAHGSVSKRR